MDLDELDGRVREVLRRLDELDRRVREVLRRSVLATERGEAARARAQVAAREADRRLAEVNERIRALVGPA